jgi:hypothetical protein
VVTIVRRVRNVTAAVFAAFATGAAVAQAAGAPAWLRIVLAAIAAAGALAAVGLVWLEHAAEREEDAAGRFADALRLLGDVDVRVGGIYLLERVARDAPTIYHGPIVEVLTAYIRARVPRPPIDSEPGTEARTSKRRPPPDVQAALRVLGRRNRERDDQSTQLRLSDVDLRGASFRSGHFEGIRLRRANLEGAHLEGAHLQGAKLRGANLRRADLGPDPELGLEGTNLAGAHLEGANFEGAKLSGAHLKGAFYDTTTHWPAGFNPEREDVVLAESVVLSTEATRKER